VLNVAEESGRGLL